jgi:hypothetical protein
MPQQNLTPNATANLTQLKVALMAAMAEPVPAD